MLLNNTECLQNRQERVISLLISEPSHPYMQCIKYFVTLLILAVELKHAVCEHGLKQRRIIKIYGVLFFKINVNNLCIFTKFF